MGVFHAVTCTEHLCDPTEEHWLPVRGWEETYRVSCKGRIWSVARKVYSGPGRERAAGGRMLSTSVDSQGYLAVGLHGKGGVSQTARVHVLVAEAFLGPRPPESYACHNDGDRTNSVASNVRYDSYSANQLDAVRHGTHHCAAKDCCKWGHPLVWPNVKSAERTHNPARICIACNRAHARLSYVRSQGRDADMQSLSDRYFESLCAAEGVDAAALRARVAARVLNLPRDPDLAEPVWGQADLLALLEDAR